MPSLGADMEEGTIIRWLVKPGDRVKRGDIVVEVETEKADMEVEVFETGTFEEIVAQEGETLPVGALLARIATDEGAAGEPAPVSAAAPAAEPEKAAPPAAPAPAAPATERAPAAVPPHATPTARVLAQKLDVDLAAIRGTGVGGAITRADVERAAGHAPARVAAERPPRVLISPYAKRLAQESGVDVESLVGTGPGGAITAADVRRETARAAPTAVEEREAVVGERPPKDRTEARKRAIADLMARSKREVPHYYLGTTIDMSTALDWLQRENSQRPVEERILYTALLLKAVAFAAHESPELNGYWEDGFRAAPHVHLGVAIALRDGSLVAPAIHDADTKPLPELMAALKDLVARARAGRLRASELAEGTITVTNLGEQGVELVHGVIFPPQVAMVGFGKIVERPWASGGMLGVRPVVTATLSGDHRASAGHQGARFLAAIDRLLQHPEEL